LDFKKGYKNLYFNYNKINLKHTLFSVSTKGASLSILFLVLVGYCFSYYLYFCLFINVESTANFENLSLILTNFNTHFIFTSRILNYISLINWFFLILSAFVFFCYRYKYRVNFFLIKLTFIVIFLQIILLVAYVNIKLIVCFIF